MFGWGRNLVVGGLAILGLAVLVGATAIRAGAHRLREGIEQAKSDDQLATEAGLALGDLGHEIEAYAEKLTDLELRRDDMAKRKRELETGLQKQKDILVRAQTLLDGTEAEFTIGGHKYSRSQVSADALERIARGEQIQQDLSFANEALVQLEAAVAEGRKNLSEVQTMQRRKTADLTHMKARLDNARLRTQINELAGQVARSPLVDHTTPTAQVLDRLESRVRRAERSAATTAHGVGEPLVNWDGEDRSLSTSQAVARFLTGATAN